MKLQVWQIRGVRGGRLSIKKLLLILVWVLYKNPLIEDFRKSNLSIIIHLVTTISSSFSSKIEGRVNITKNNTFQEFKY